MTVVQKFIAPPYLQIFIADPTGRDTPMHIGDIAIIASKDCVSIPCRYHYEGDAELLVGSNAELAIAEAPLFEMTIPTPSRRLVFDDAELTVWLEVPVASDQTRLRIWTDGLQLPERIVVAVD